ncbi:MAG TPA: hypothetical protein VK399_03905 [Longimicrobiaceae bacterium]|nr:hypothetical protein [Longimicrobiaceae bacterium]
MSIRPLLPYAALALLAAAPLAAQTPADTLPPGRPAVHRRSPLLAGAVEYLVPTLGHAYAGDWERGLPPAGVTVLGAAGVVAGFGDCLDETGCDLFLAGIATFAAGKLWGIWSAVDAARDRNRALAAGLRPALSVRSGELRMGVSLPGAGSMPAAYVRISVPVRGAGDYALGPRDAAMTYLQGGDVRTAYYATTRAGAGTLSIREYGDGWVAGSVTFGAEAAQGERPVGPAARFEGSFRAPIRQQP